MPLLPQLVKKTMTSSPSVALSLSELAKQPSTYQW